MKMMQFVTKLTAATALLASTAVLKADPVIYATGHHPTGGRQFIMIDVGAGKVTTNGSLGVVGAMGLAFAPDGTAYSVTESCGSCAGIPRLVTIERTSGEVTVIAPTTPRTKFMGIVYSPQGILYGVDAASGGGSGSLFTIDPATGQAAKVGINGGGGDIMDLAFHPDGTLYGIDGAALYRVDLSTGKRTLVKTLRGLSNPMGLVIDRDGTFYASDQVPLSPIVRIDITTGQTTPVLKTTIDYIHGLDMLPPPRLKVTRQTSQMVLSWPGWATGYALQVTDSVGANAQWTDAGMVPVVVGGLNVLTNSFDGQRQFFRLIQR